MDASLLGRLAALSVLLLLLAGTSAAHAALLKLNRGRIRHLAAEGVPRARSVASLVDDAVSVETTLAAANAAVIAMGAITLVLLAGDDPADTLGAFYGIGAGGLLIMVWVHLASRAAGSSRPEDTIHLLRWPLRVLHLLFKPLMLLLQQVVRRVIPDEPRPASAGTFAADHDFWMIDATTEEDRSLEAEEKEWIHGIFEMGGTTAREIMVPRVDMAAVKADEPLREVLRKIRARGHSRIPVYEETIDNIIGVVHAKDLLSHMEVGSLDEPARTLSRPSYYIPESKKIDELLHEMQLNKVHMAIVVDEYGGTAGLVCLEDLLEEIVGEIHDEYDVEEKTIDRLSDVEAVFDARVSIHDVNDTLHIALANGEYDTVGGLVYDRLGKIPVVGDEVQLDGMSLRVLSTVGKRIKKVKIRVETEVPSERNPGSSG